MLEESQSRIKAEKPDRETEAEKFKSKRRQVEVKVKMRGGCHLENGWTSLMEGALGGVLRVKKQWF